MISGASQVVAIIPARAGSKRILAKNIKTFLGKPIIGYSIEAAKKTGIFDRIIVSTEDERVAQIAQSFGAEVPFMRPLSLADDYVPVGDVIKHAVQWVSDNDRSVEFSCGIYATAPMISSDDIVRGYKGLKNAPHYKSALAVTSFGFPIQRALKVVEGEGLKMIQPENRLVRSQDLETCFHDAAQFFWSRNSVEGVSANCGALPIVIDRSRVQDIDTVEDWCRAEYLYQAMEMMTSREPNHV